jgi:hypothetical protein
VFLCRTQKGTLICKSNIPSWNFQLDLTRTPQFMIPLRNILSILPANVTGKKEYKTFVAAQIATLTTRGLMVYTNDHTMHRFYGFGDGSRDVYNVLDHACKYFVYRPTLRLLMLDCLRESFVQSPCSCTYAHSLEHAFPREALFDSTDCVCASDRLACSHSYNNNVSDHRYSLSIRNSYLRCVWRSHCWPGDL